MVRFNSDNLNFSMWVSVSCDSYVGLSYIKLGYWLNIWKAKDESLYFISLLWCMFGAKIKMEIWNGIILYTLRFHRLCLKFNQTEIWLHRGILVNAVNDLDKRNGKFSLMFCSLNVPTLSISHSQNHKLDSVIRSERRKQVMISNSPFNEKFFHKFKEKLKYIQQQSVST